MKNLHKKLLTFLFSLGISMTAIISTTSMSNVAFAHVNSTIINDTQNTAYQLTQNTITDSLNYNPKRVNGCFLSDSNDTDWYKVFLSAGTQTLTINSSNNNKIADVYSQNGTPISTGTFGPSTKQSQKIQVADSGIYYIKIHSNETFNTKSYYSIFVGAPWYKRGSYSESLNTMTLTSFKKTSNTAYFDLTNTSSIPNTAVVEHIYLNGSEVNKNAVNNKIRSIKANSQNSWTDISGPVLFDEDVLNTTNPTPLKQGWAFKHSVSSFYGSSTRYSLSPIVKFDYLYEDNNI